MGQRHIPRISQVTYKFTTVVKLTNTCTHDIIILLCAHCSANGHPNLWENTIYPGMKQALIHVLQVTQGEIEHRKVDLYISFLLLHVHVHACDPQSISSYVYLISYDIVEFI